MDGWLGWRKVDPWRRLAAISLTHHPIGIQVPAHDIMQIITRPNESVAWIGCQVDYESR